MRWLDGITDSMGMSLSKLKLQSMGSQRVGCNLATEQQQQSFLIALKVIFSTKWIRYLGKKKERERRGY